MHLRDPNTERGIAQANSNERAALQATLDLCPYPAVLVQTDSEHVILANEVARDLGLTLFGAVPPQDCFALDSEGQRIDSEQLLHHLLTQAEKQDSVDITWQTPQRSFNFRVCARTRSADAGRPALALLTFLDVSAEKAAEKQLRQTIETRDEFFSIAAHELRDPLFALQLSLQFLRHSAERQGSIPPHVAQHLEVSDRQAERLGRLIENLLDVSRIDNQRLELEMESLDLGELARELMQRFQARARLAGSTLTVEDGEPVVGSFDRVKMEQVLGNLLSNAIKYGGGKPVVVRVRNQGDQAVLEVEDRGNGIAVEDQQRIFERFQRASDGHKKESLGLGLYITRALIEGHGGNIAVRSTPGNGTTFIVTLPRQPRQSSEATREADTWSKE